MSLIFDEALSAARTAEPPREPVYARGGLAASAHPFVTQTALEVLRSGGNAVDAAVAAAAVLMVVEPRNGHLGGEGFMLVSRPGSNVVALNGSGAAPAGARLADYRASGMPGDGLRTSTVPGVVDLWATALAQLGTRSLDTLLAPAIAYARNGVPVTPRFHQLLARDAPVYAKYPASAHVFLPGGVVPPVGSLLAQPLLADALSIIAAGGADSFYRGELTHRMVDFSERNGGLFALADFDAHRTEIAAPLESDYRGYTIVEQPPVSQGIVVLLALNTLQHFDLGALPNESAQRYHLIVEALKLAFEDRALHLGDPRTGGAPPVDRLLSRDHAQAQAARIDPRAAARGAVPAPVSPDTTFAAFADADGMMVNYIHSLYAGSGVVMGDTGVLMNSRMTGFSLDPASPNVLAPGKRPVHTLNTFMVRKDGETIFAGGTPGAHWQVQTNVQILSCLLDHGMNAAAAIAAPRLTIGDQFGHDNDRINIEGRVDPAILAELRTLGHTVNVIGPWESGGAMQLIGRDPRSGMLSGASEVRRPGCNVSGY